MKKTIVIFLTTLLGINLAHGEENKLEVYAKSPKITRLYIKIDDKKLRYAYTKEGEDPTSITATANPDTLNDTTFRYKFETNRPLKIYIEDFNPLQHAFKVEAEDTTTDINDPSAFFEALSEYKPFFVVDSEMKEHKGKNINLTDNSTCKLNTHKDDLFKAINYKGQEDNGEQKKLSDISVTEDTLKGWQSRTTSESGIGDVIEEIDVISGKLESNIQALQEHTQAIQNTLGSTTCANNIIRANLSMIAYLIPLAKETTDRRKSTLAALNALRTHLNKHTSNWSDDYYLISAVTRPADKNLKKVTINVKKIELAGKNDTVAIKTAEKDTASSAFKVYKHESIVMEPSIGFVYSPLTSNKFSTKVVNDDHVVEKTEESDNYHAAAFLNVYYTEWLKESVYPFWQLGLSTAKEYPALLTGLGMKIRDTEFALSGGIALGFTKELDKLSVGDTVSGQADIDKDVETEIQQTWYLSLQYQF